MKVLCCVDFTTSFEHETIYFGLPFNLIVMLKQTTLAYLRIEYAFQWEVEHIM